MPGGGRGDPHSLTYPGLILCEWMAKPHHHTKLELIGCLGYKETAGSLYSIKGPWGPLPLTKLACIWLRMYRWSNPIIIPNKSSLAALVIKKQQTLYVPLRGPGAHNPWLSWLVYVLGTLNLWHLWSRLPKGTSRAWGTVTVYQVWALWLL